jgi:hypothetical protein
VAVAQRRLLLGLVVGIVLNVLLRTTSGGVVALILVLALGVAIYNILWVVRLCRALGKTPWLRAVAMLIPVVGLIVLAVLNQQATTYLRAHGLKVGFFGTKA